MEKNLTSGSVLKSILFFSLPYLLSYFLQTLYGMADLFIIGQFEGVASTTAVSIGSQVMHMITVMIVGLAMGATVTIGRAVGLAGTEGAMMLLIINVIFGIVYGAYTLFWMPETLPRYYDENHVCNFAQGAFHMHIPGVYYNNRNWLHVLKAMRVWCVVSMLLTPLCTAAAVVFEQATGWQVWRAVLIGYIASLFGAIVIPAKKYQ